VDELGPNAPIDWALEHFPERRPERLRWINDTSVNILYYDAQSASEALVALTSPEAGDPSSIPAQESRIARPYSLNPDVTLRVRQANSGDQKPRKAGQRSEYYKRYPQARERAPKRERREEAPQYLDYDGNGSGERNGRRYWDHFMMRVALTLVVRALTRPCTMMYLLREIQGEGARTALERGAFGTEVTGTMSTDTDQGQTGSYFFHAQG
jgi:hypothetical protein